MLALQVEERAMAMACAENTAEGEADMKRTTLSIYTSWESDSESKPEKS